MKRYGFHITSLFLITLSLVVFLTEISGSPVVGKVKEVSARFVLPVINLKESIFIFIEDRVSRYILLVNLKEENISLRRELETCKVEEAELNTYKRTLNRLGKELGIENFKSLYGIIFSRIMYYDPSGLDNFVVVSVGSRSGVKRGDIVLSKGSVVGKVREVYTTTSTVITPLNSELNLSVLLENSGKAYIYKGRYPVGELLYVNKKDKVEPGDKVLYRDPQGRLPNFEVGYVSSIEEGKNPFFKRVYVKPVISPRNIELVIVLTKGKER